MSLPRFALSLLLTLALAGAPVVQTLAMAAASAPEAAGMHAGHATPPDDAAASAKHSQHNKSCAQHDLCNGTCCIHCAQCFTGALPLLFQVEILRPALTPSVQHLSFSTLSPPRERPPRTFSL